MKHLLALMLALGAVTAVACKSQDEQAETYEVDDASETVSMNVALM